jgi:hypothetical protein
MEWFVIVALILIGLTWLYSRQMAALALLPGLEGFASGGSRREGGPEAMGPDMAPVNQGVLLADMLTAKPALSDVGAAGCAAMDRARELEFGGQYEQRTNNYARDYPDTCSAPFSVFVGSIYTPSNGVGMTVPCT